MRKFQTCKLLIALLTSATLSFAQNAEKATPAPTSSPAPASPASPYYLLIEPSFMKPPILTPVPGATQTLLVPSIKEGDKLRYLTKDEMRGLHMTRVQFDTMTKVNATKALEQIQPHPIRGPKDIIEFMVLETNNQLAASAVLAPGFGKRFETTFGSDLIVLIPSRNLVYVFPKLEGRYNEMRDTIIDQYQTSICPVSCELFEVKDGEIEAIGTFRQ